MGTRHLIAVQTGGVYKVAQYGQWDGYPQGQGTDVLAFCRDAAKLAALREKAPATTWLTAADYPRIDATPNWPKVYPWLSRDAGADVLGHVADQPAGLGLKNSIDFAADSVMCEWAYVVDLDANVLEAFRGFNRTPVPPSARFAEIERAAGGSADYGHVKLVGRWPLDALPTDDAFVEACEREGDEATNFGAQMAALLRNV